MATADDIRDIIQGIQRTGLQKQALAHRLDIAPSQLSHMLRGRRPMDARTAHRIRLILRRVEDALKQ